LGTGWFLTAAVASLSRITYVPAEGAFHCTVKLALPAAAVIVSPETAAQVPVRTLLPEPASPNRVEKFPVVIVCGITKVFAPAEAVTRTQYAKPLGVTR